MDEDLFAYAVVTEKMPPENRTSCLAEANHVLRKMLGRLMAAQGINNLNMTALEWDMAPPAHVKRDKNRNINATIDD